MFFFTVIDISTRQVDLHGVWWKSCSSPVNKKKEKQMVPTNILISHANKSCSDNVYNFDKNKYYHLAVQEQ